MSMNITNLKKWVVVLSDTLNPINTFTNYDKAVQFADRVGDARVMDKHKWFSTCMDKIKENVIDGHVTRGVITFPRNNVIVLNCKQYKRL